MTDVSFFWIAFGAYLAGMFALGVAAVRRGSDVAARLGRGLVWLGLLAQTVSIVWRSFVLGTEPVREFLPGLRAAFTQGPAWQAWVYGLLFALAVLAGLIGVVFRRRRPVWLVAAGVTVMLELILLDFLNFTRLPIEKVYEYLSIASWVSALALLAVSPLIRLVVVDAALAVTTALLAVFAAIHPHDIELQLVPALQSYWLFIHVALTSIGFAIFGIAYVVAGLLLVKTYDRAAVSASARRRSRLALALAVAMGVAAVLGLVTSKRMLPFEPVAFAPHELEPAKQAQGTDSDESTEDAEAAKPAAPRPPVGVVQGVRYGGALVGAVGAVAYGAYWIAFACLRPRGERAGLGSYQFLISGAAFFVACLVLAGFARHQEKAIATLFEERNELVLLHNKLLDAKGDLPGQALADEIERMKQLARQARRVLGQARWLPLTLENQTRFAGDSAYQELQDLYVRTDSEWKLPIRYKDIKQIGSALDRRVSRAEAVKARLRMPADRAEVVRTVDAMLDEAKRREARALLPRTKEGQVAAFVGLALLLAIPLAVGLDRLARRLRDLLPDAAMLDRISYVAVAVGYPVFTFGALFAGAIWAHFAWGTWWGWDPKEVGSLVAWVLYTIYLHQRYREGLSPRAAAVAAMLGFLAAVLSLAGNTFLGGLHAYS
jgi:ABC-type transport system involved in cytochrome c biogenesis permease subunit